MGIAPSLAKQEGWSFEVSQSRYIRQPRSAATLKKNIERAISTQNDISEERGGRNVSADLAVVLFGYRQAVRLLPKSIQ